MQITLNLDNVTFSHKPMQKNGEIGGVCNRTKNKSAITTIEAAALKDYITKGITFAPAALTGTTSDCWQSQQIICVDIDNETFLKDSEGKFVYAEPDENGKRKQVRIQIENPTSPQQALEILAANNIKPMMLYKSFSYTAEWERFRVIVLLDAPLNDVNIAMDYTRRLAQLFNGGDTAIATPERLIFGGKADCIILDEPSNINNAAVFEQLPPYIAPIVETAPAISKTSDIVKPLAHIQVANKISAKLSTEDMKARLKQDIDTFDMLQFIVSNSDARPVKVGRTMYAAPCPVCGRDSNHLHIRGNSWQCYDTNNYTGHKGGTIIDYLMAVYGLSKADAMAKFEYDIMGYSIEDKKAAYREERQAEEAAALDMEEWKVHKENNMQPAATEQPAETPKQPQIDPLTAWIDKIQTEAYRPYKTDLKFFDNLLQGGVIQQSLFILMAAPGTGKTTLCQQIAEEMASNEKPVIYLNFEMSREQMFAKAISYRLAKKRQRRTALDVLQGYNWSENDKQEIMAVVEEYRNGAYKYITYCPDNLSSNLDAIIEYLNKIGNDAAAAGKQAPAVIVDYLHLITKQGLDNQELIKQVVTGLKQYAIKFNTFVIGISATNRSSKDRLSLDSGRDSSNLEYTGDYMISLNYDDVDSGAVSTNEPDKMALLQQETYRRMILRVLKGRFVTPGRTANIYYDAANNIFYDKDDFMPNDEGANPFSYRVNKAATPKR